MNDVPDIGKGQAINSVVEQNKEEPKRISTSTEVSQTLQETDSEASKVEESSKNSTKILEEF